MDSTNEREGQDEGPNGQTEGGGGRRPSEREAHGSSNESAGRNETSSRPESGSAGSNHRREFGLFDRLMDGMMGIHRGSGVTTSLRSGDSNPASGGSLQGDSIFQGSRSGESEATATFPNLENGGAIIITINYVFSDENDPLNPNRSGSLVMTLPNNASNRDPRVIQEFIRLATQMAYSTIVNGIKKDSGISIDKFNSFPLKQLEELSVESRNCSICFEKFEELSCSKKRGLNEIQDQDVECKGMTGANASKKRKTNDVTPVGPITASNLNEGEQNDTASNDNSINGRKLLGEYQGTFRHLAIEMPCGHIFGKSCLFEWLKDHSTCPLCRDSVSNNQNGRGDENNEGNINNSQTAPSNENSNQHHLLNLVGSTSGGTNILNASNDQASQHLARFLLPNHSSEDTHSLNTDSISSPTPPRTSTGNQDNDSGIFSHILTFLRGSRLSENEPLFPTGVSSRRTERGVETRSTRDTQSDEAVLDYMNLGSLFDDNQNNENADQSGTRTNREGNQNNDQ